MKRENNQVMKCELNINFFNETTELKSIIAMLEVTWDINNYFCVE